MSAATRTVFGTRTCVVLSVSPSSAVAVKFLVLFVLPISFHILLAGVSISVFTKTIQSTPLRSSVGVQLVSAMRWQSIAYFVFMLASVVVITLLGFYAPLAMEALYSHFFDLHGTGVLASSRLHASVNQRRLLEGSSVELVVRTACRSGLEFVKSLEVISNSVAVYRAVLTIQGLLLNCTTSIIF
ncbi:hypothetical protein DL96DRAFT_849340 [Flagelloscypha sp. PMI_526]|nr:hypothetical protein DL96DRAFT_849340 [Flagelloscypha sp. PMI_526]